MKGDWYIAEILYRRRASESGSGERHRLAMPAWRLRLASWVLGQNALHFILEYTFRALVLDELEGHEPERVKRATAVILAKQEKINANFLRT